MILHVTSQWGAPIYNAMVFAASTTFFTTDMPHYKEHLFRGMVNNKAQAFIPETDLNVFIRVRAPPFLEHECVTAGERAKVVVVLKVDDSFEGVEGYGWAFYGRKHLKEYHGEIQQWD